MLRLVRLLKMSYVKFIRRFPASTVCVRFPLLSYDMRTVWPFLSVLQMHWFLSLYRYFSLVPSSYSVAVFLYLLSCTYVIRLPFLSVSVTRLFLSSYSKSIVPPSGNSWCVTLNRLSYLFLTAVTFLAFTVSVILPLSP